VSAIDPKVRVRRQEERIGLGLRHADEAGIGKSHWNIRVLLEKMERPFELVAQVESRDDGVSPKELRKLVGAASFQEMEGLGQDRLACSPRRRKSIDHGGRPFEVEIPAV